MMAVKKTMDHGAYQHKTKSMTEEELYYTMRDCKQAMEANPRGINDSYYADEINYCGMELARRKSKLNWNMDYTYSEMCKRLAPNLNLYKKPY